MPVCRRSVADPFVYPPTLLRAWLPGCLSACLAACREREAKRKEMAARETELEGRLRQLHTWETQLAAKQRSIEEYISLVRLLAGC